MRFRSWPNQFQGYMNRHPVIAGWLSCAWVLGLSFVVFVWNLGSVGLVDETEPLFAEAARQMTVTGDWITPMFNAETRFDKPPLVYWLMALCYQTLGVNEWAARLPSALSAIALVGACFWILWRFAPLHSEPASAPLSALALPPEDVSQSPFQPNWIAAWLGSALMCLHPLTLIWARTGVSDMLLSTTMGMSLIAFFAGYAQPQRPKVQTRWYILFYIMMALAVLTKGPVGVVIPFLVIILFSLYLGNWRKLWQEIHLLPGLLLTLAISVPWFVLVTLRNGEAYIDAFFGYHNFDRFVSVVNRHSAPWYFYFIIVLIGFMPWSTYLPSAIAALHLKQRQFWQHQPREQHLGLFACSWFLSIFGFFTISVTKLPSYMIPLMPAAALLVALFWSHRLQQESWDRSWRWSSWLQVGILALYTAIFWALPQLIGPDPAAPLLKQDLQAAGIFWGSTLIWGLATLLELFFLLQRDILGLWLVNAVAFLIFVAGILQPLTFVVDTHRQLPLRQVARLAPQHRHAREPLLMFGFKKPTVVFYSQNTFGFYWEGEDYLKEWVTKTPRPTALVVLTPKSLAALPLQTYQAGYQLIEDRGNYLLIRLFAKQP